MKRADPEWDLSARRMSVEELDRRIAALLEQVAQLKRVRRAKLGGLASGRAPRRPRNPDDRIVAVYDARVRANDGRKYGVLKATAAEVGVPVKAVQRALARRKDGQRA